MTRFVSKLADYTVTAWVMDGATWRFVFDSSERESVVQHELLGVSCWRTSELRDCIGVMEIDVQPAPSGGISYTLETTCAETIEVVCADVREIIIKDRMPRK